MFLNVSLTLFSSVTEASESCRSHYLWRYSVNSHSCLYKTQHTHCRSSEFPLTDRRLQYNYRAHYLSLQVVQMVCLLNERFSADGRRREKPADCSSTPQRSEVTPAATWGNFIWHLPHKYRSDLKVHCGAVYPLVCVENINLKHYLFCCLLRSSLC